MGTRKTAEQRIKLTNASVRAIPLVESGKTYVYDTVVPYFCVRVTPANKYYALRRRINGKEYQRKIGGTEEYSADAAREIASRMSGELRQGIDKRALAVEEEKSRKEMAVQQRQESLTVREALTDYLLRNKLSERTKRDYEYLIQHELKKVADKPLRDLTRPECERLRESIRGENENPTRSVHALRLVRTLCRSNRAFANTDWERFFSRGFTVRVRATKLVPADGRAILKSLESRDSKAAVDYFKALLLTGCRRSELNKLKPASVDVEAKTITLKTSKNGDPHVIYMSKQLCEIVIPLVKNCHKDDNIFGNCSDPRKTLERTRLDIGKHFTLQGLRQLASLTLTELHFPIHVIDAILNHKPTSVTAKHYARPTAEQKAVAWAAISDYYYGSGQVIPFPAKVAA